MPPALMPVLFEGDDRGVNAVVQLGLPVDQEGVYWLDVFLDDEKDGPCVTRVPLRVFYQPMQTSALR